MEYVRQNPGTIALLASAASLMLGLGMIVGPILGVIGFGSAGPAVGSIAADAQVSMRGQVATGGLFAILQSAAMGGYGAAIVNEIMAGVVGVGTGIGSALECLCKKDEAEEEGDKEEKSSGVGTKEDNDGKEEDAVQIRAKL